MSDEAANRRRRQGPYTERDVLTRYTLLVPRTFHMVLAFVLLILALLPIITSWVLFKHAPTFMIGYVAPALGVAMCMLVVALPRNVAKYVDPKDYTAYILIPSGSDIFIMGAAIAGVILCGAGAINLILALADCPNRTVQSLCQYIFESTDNCSPVSNWTPTYRLPYFATQAIWDQICLDDYAYTIAFVVALLANLVVLVIVAILLGTARAATVRMLQRKALPEFSQRLTGLDLATPSVPTGVHMVSLVLSAKTETPPLRTARPHQ